MTNYEWNEDFYKEIVKDHNYRFPKYNSIDYPLPSITSKEDRSWLKTIHDITEVRYLVNI